ncbi:uncharacterized protein [Littorina saxatilis]|uniref:Uncharacterized protein n=1 Tax=Littorina saxatilis TaxID=31220 RepID=A0AAN9GFY6_9CAEN
MATAAGSSTSSPTYGGQQCKICKEIEKEHLHGQTIMLGQSDLFKDVIDPDGGNKTKRKEQKKTALHTFLKHINALLNDGYGLVCIHTAEPNLLGLFDQAVNKRMLDMIPDDTFFDDNFERNYCKDKHHIVFRIIQRERPISTFSFNTKASTDTGLVNPSHGQMRYFLKHKMNVQPDPAPNVKYTFVKDQEVKVTVVGSKKGLDIDFQESMSVQAKQMPETSVGPKDLVDHCFEKLFVQNYISAFAKLQKGGSLFLGVREHKNETKRWTEVDTNSELHKHISAQLSEHGGGLKLYKDNNDLLHVCLEDQVPTDTNTQTGQFKCQGVKAGDETAQSAFKTEFLEQAKRRLFWHSSQAVSGSAQKVQVDFCAVETDTLSSEHLAVIKIYIPKFRGVCFTDESGPEAYQYQNQTQNGSGKIVRVEKNLWISKNS